MSAPSWLRDRGLWAVVVAALVAYGTALSGTFVYDDVHSVRDNEAIRDLGRLVELLWNPAAFSSLDNRMYRPVLLVSFALDHAVGGGAAWTFKLTNVLLHAACATLLRSLAKALGSNPAAATAAAVVFALHPLASEAVNMVSARSELLQLLGMLAAVLFHVRGGRFAPWLAAAGTVVACGAKEPGVLTPALLLVADLARGRGQRLPVRAIVARVAPALGTALLWLVLRRLVLGVATVRVPPLQGIADALSGGSRGLEIQLATMATLLPRCLLQVLVPLGLSIDPPVTLLPGFFDPRPVCGVLGLFGLVAFALWRGDRAVRVGTSLAVACSLPWILVPLNLMLSEHRLYGLLAGCSLAASSVRVPVRAATPALRIVAVAACAVLALRSSLRSLDYRDEVVLWQQVLARDPDSPRALFALGVSRLAADDPRSARPLFERAIDLYPRYWRARRQLAITELQMPREEQHPFTALYLAQSVREQSPRDPFVRLLCAGCLVAVGEWSGDAAYFVAAEREALSCLEIAEPKGQVYIAAARARELTGDVDGAVGLLDASIACGLDHVSVHVAKAETLARAGRRQEARRLLLALLAKDPFDPAPREALARLESLPARPR